MNEFELLARLTPTLAGNPSVLTGAGDDCAVLDCGQPGRVLLFKTDAVVGGIHFTADAKPEQIGHKALGRCLSDIAAMGGRPIAALVTLALPDNYSPEFIEGVYKGLNALARKFGVAIAGGETTRNPERLLISIAMIGDAAKDKCILRSGAKPGDAIYVTGELGGSRAGKHLDFEPRVAEGQWLTEHFTIHAMMDISDGLAGDLRHILRMSQVGAELHSRAVPVSRAAKLQASAESSSKPPLLAALGDGEDFELLFTIASKDAVPVLDAWKKQFPDARLSCIGRITSERGLKLRDKTGIHSLETHGYVHFA